MPKVDKAFTIAKSLHAEFNAITLYSESDREWTEELLYYVDGVYRYGARSKIEEAIVARWPQDATMHFIRETINRIRCIRKVERDGLNTQPYLINVKNGVVLLDDSGLVSGFIPHTPGILSTIQVPVNYDPDATCPKFVKFLHDVVDDESAMTILEFIGYCLYRSQPLEKWLLLVGEGENGKSRLVKAIERFLGSSNVTHTTLQSLASSRFASSSLFGKLANLVPDLPSTDLKDTGIIKTVASQDSLSGEKKGKDAFDFESFAKLVFSANHPPRVSDREQSHAFWRRILYIEFKNQFLEGDPKRDPFIVDKITTPAELSGLLNMALDGLGRVLVRGGFTFTKTPDEIAVKYNVASDPVKTFVDEFCGFGDDYVIATREAHETYNKEFCPEFETAPMSETAFSLNFKRVCGTHVYKGRYYGKSGFRGVGLIKGKYASTSLGVRLY